MKIRNTIYEIVVFKFHRNLIVSLVNSFEELMLKSIQICTCMTEIASLEAFLRWPLSEMTCLKRDFECVDIEIISITLWRELCALWICRSFLCTNSKFKEVENVNKQDRTPFKL